MHRIKLPFDTKLWFEGSCLLKHSDLYMCRLPIASYYSTVPLSLYQTNKVSLHRLERLDKNRTTYQSRLIMKKIASRFQLLIKLHIIKSIYTYIEDNCIIAAHSIAKGKLHSNYIYGGNPIKQIKSFTYWQA